MTMSIYDTNVLIRSIELLKEPSEFMLDTFFPNTVTATSEFVTIDIFTNKRRLAPFVDPLVEGKFVEQLGIASPTYKPAYLKPKTRLDPLRPIRRMMGERIGGDLTPQQRAQANLAFEQQQQIDMINRRLEWMAVQAMATGALTVVGESVPATSISFGRDPSLQIALTGTARWGQTGVSPVDNLDTWSAQVLQESGFPVTDVVFTPSAWNYFRSDPQVAAIVASLANGNSDFAAAQPGARKGGQYMGTWANYRLWRYYEWYVDPTTNVEMPMMVDGTVIMGSRDVDGTRAFATIIDDEIGYPSIPYAPKTWVTHDPGARWLMTQSAPIVIPTRVNASLAATVM